MLDEEPLERLQIQCEEEMKIAGVRNGGLIEVAD